MLKLYQNIRKYRVEKGYTQSELAKKMGYADKSAISKIENGKVDLPQSQILKFSEVLDVDPGVLVGNDGLKSIVLLDKESKVRIPILGHVAAGIPIEMYADVIGYTLFDDDPDGEYFGLVIKGDSMEPRMYDGDVVIVRRQPDVESGEIAIVAVGGADATCKRVVKYPEGISLVSLNSSKYVPKMYSNKDIKDLPITIIGKVVELKGKIN